MEEIKLDLSWKNPSKAQLSALRMVCTRLGIKMPQADAHYAEVMASALWNVMASEYREYGVRRAMTPYEYAEMVVSAKHSLWYTQAKRWSVSPPPQVVGMGKDVWASACRAICDIVDSGYNESTDTWWDISSYHKDSLCVILLDFGNMLMQYRDGTDDIVSNGFVRFINLICDKRWMAQVRKRARQAKPYTSSKCICPECENMVAPIGVEPQGDDFKNYRATGACQKGHNGYQCSKCGVPHSYVSGIGVSHLTYRNI